MKKKIMNKDKNVEISNPNFSGDFRAQASVDPFLDEFLKSSTTPTCLHTHTCNAPGPHESHTHTCYHTHTQLVTSEEDNHSNNNSDKGGESSKARRPSGNREAVRKYREKKKAHTTYLEEEVKKLRVVNQHLVKKLQGQVFLQAEVTRLRGLLADLRGKLETELDGYSFRRPCNTTVHANLPCFNPNNNVSSSFQGDAGWNCQPPVLDCRGNGEGQTTLDTVDSLVSSASQVD